MKNKTFLSIIVLLAIAYMLIYWMSPEQEVMGQRHLPWNVEVLPDGRSEVFGIIIGRSTLADVQRQLNKRGDVAIFEDKDGRLSAEAFFSEATFSGLTGRLIVVVSLPADELAQIRDNSRKQEPLESGGTKYTPVDADWLQFYAATVEGLTYIPYADLDEEIVLKRFGDPERKVQTSEQQQHWLYPRIGLDLILDEDEKEVLQYVAPRDFQQLREPLQEEMEQNPS